MRHKSQKILIAILLEQVKTKAVRRSLKRWWMSMNLSQERLQQTFGLTKVPKAYPTKGGR